MNELPEELWLGKIDGEWPLIAFSAAQQARDWLAMGAHAKRKRLWKVDIGNPVEMTLTPRVEQKLVEKVDE